MFDLFSLVGIAVVGFVAYSWYKNPEVVKEWWAKIKAWF